MDRDARMLALCWSLVAVWSITIHEINAAPPRSIPGRVLVRWIGQDGRDYVGPNNRPEPSDVQDIHLQIDGLDPDREVVFVDVTGQGGDQWHFNEKSFAWKAEFQRTKGSRMGDLFLEPARVEAGRSFHIVVRYNDGQILESDFRGRAASPRVRMPNAKLVARWVGQDGNDWTSTGPSVGPDGLQDVSLRLTGISTKVATRSLLIEEDGGTRWEFGVNPRAHHNAELILDQKERSGGNLYFQPTRDLKGRSFKLTITYVNETIDVCAVPASACDPNLAMPKTPLPKVLEPSLSVKWIGQRESTPAGPGAVQLELGGWDAVKPVVGVVLTDSIQGSWAYRADRPEGRAFHVDDFSETLVFLPREDGTGIADLYFAPYRDEADATLTLRLVRDDGSMAITRFRGAACDPGRRSAGPRDSRIEARPGDDLQALVSRGGSVFLVPGTYQLSRPLVLDQPVTLSSDGKAILLFSQAHGDLPWTTAIKIHRGHTTLDHFQVRFAGPIRWKDDVSYGPAVIGATDNFDTGHDDPKFNLKIIRMDLEIPPVSDPGSWTDAVRLIRLRNARSGLIAGNILRGGPIEFFDGPWRIENNRFRGTVPGTVSPTVFAGHQTHDLILKGNWAEPQGPDGKTWRFLVLTVKGTGDLISGNTIKRIGPRDDDTIPWANAPETILTESYQLTYEGKLLSLSEDGRILGIGKAQGYPAQTGSVVSLLTGPAAGTWRKVAQAIDSTTYLVDEPIPTGTGIVSIARGFVGETFELNTIDTRGGKRASHLVFAGNHYGTRLLKNHSLGAEDAFRLAACPTEAPMTWGWSHAPFLGGTIADNIFEDSGRGGVIGVEHNQPVIKSNRGRVYMTASVDRNVFRWSEAFISSLPRSGMKGLPVGLTIGVAPSLDPGEIRIQANGNRVEVPPRAPFAPILSVPAADFNSRRIVDGKFRFLGDPSFKSKGENSRTIGTGGSRPAR